MTTEVARLHRLKNKLAIIVGFCEMLLADMAADDPRRADVAQILDAGTVALGELLAPSADTATPPIEERQLAGAAAAPRGGSGGVT